MPQYIEPKIIPSINILLYHQVGDSPNTLTNLDCFCDVNAFDSQMAYLYNSDYNVISLTKAIDLLSKNQMKSKYVVLTFDDGCSKFYDTTFPILDKYGFPATIYPVAGYLGRLATWGTFKNPDLQILSASQLVELNKLGVEIGGHTLDHVKLTEVSEAEALEQVQGCKDSLEQLLGVRVNSFAYPHGRYNQKTIDIVKYSGFMNALTCINKTVASTDSVFELPRKYVTYHDDLKQFIQKLA